MSIDFKSLANPGLRDLNVYQPGKPICELQRELGLAKIVKLASNENPLGPSPKVLEALTALQSDIALYPDGSAYQLKQALANLYGLSEDRFIPGAGLENVIDMIFRTFVSPQDSIVISQYSFALYALGAKAIGAEIREAPAKNYCTDLDAMFDAIAPNTKMICIVNPNNPTGTWTKANELKQFVARVPAHILVVIDEAYAEYVDHPDYPNTLSWLDAHPNVIVARTFSKAYSLASLRVGYGIAHPEVIDLLNRARQPFNVSAFAQAAAVAALSDQAHVEKGKALNFSEYEKMCSALEAKGLDYIPSMCNFISIDVKRSAQAVFQSLLEKGVIVRPLQGYQMPEHIRVSLGLPEENEFFLRCLDEVLG